VNDCVNVLDDVMEIVVKPFKDKEEEERWQLLGRSNKRKGGNT